MLRSLMALLLAALAPAAAVATPPPAGQFLDRSFVTLPERAGIFVHERSRIDTGVVQTCCKPTCASKAPCPPAAPSTKAPSVRADYGAPSKPGDPWIAVHITPRGRVDEAVAVAALAKALENDMRSPIFKDLVALPPTPIRVEAPGLPASMGSRQSFTYMDRDGQIARHAGLVFHRHLFDIDLRVRVAADDMSQAKFDRLADQAARAIVPKLDLRSFGQCGDRADEEHCVRAAAGAKDAAPVDRVQHVLVYPPGVFNGEAIDAITP